MKDFMIVHPCERVAGTVQVPGDKSISHRVAILSALAAGRSTVRGFLRSEDCLNTLKALEQVGARVTVGPEEIVVDGSGGAFKAPSQALDLGNSGTGMRLLTGLFAGQPFTTELTGDASLRSRPMTRIKEPLERMGATVELLGKKGCAPVRVSGGRLRGIEYVLPVASAQVKTSVLLAGLFAEGATTVVESQQTRDHTERLFAAAGIPVTVDGLTVRVTGGGAAGVPVRACDWVVPGDFSSAAFWLVAAACREGSEIVVEGIGLNPRRTALLDVLARMGADVTVTPSADAAAGEARGAIRVRGRRLKATTIEGKEIPNLIDEIPILAVAGAMAAGTTVIRDAAELRVKESDRIATMAWNLKRMGVDVEERPDGLIVTGPAAPHAASPVESLGDHRIAMAMAVLALFSDAPVRVGGVSCIATSYPTFWDDLRLVGGHAEEHCDH